jgi:hypothetical protein
MEKIDKKEYINLLQTKSKSSIILFDKLYNMFSYKIWKHRTIALLDRFIDTYINYKIKESKITSHHMGINDMCLFNYEQCRYVLMCSSLCSQHPRYESWIKLFVDDENEKRT